MTFSGYHPGTMNCIPALYPRIVGQSIGIVGTVPKCNCVNSLQRRRISHLDIYLGKTYKSEK